MRSDGQKTRAKIIETAQKMFLTYGYGGTSVDAVVQEAGVTKGTFFYHFESKEDLAYAAVESFARNDREILGGALARAENLSRDPLQQLLIFLGLFVEMFDGLSEPHPGCLYTSYCYENGLMNDQTLGLVKEAILFARGLMEKKLVEARAVHKPLTDFDNRALADQFTVIFEGAFVLSKMLKDPGLMSRQLKIFRASIEALFGLAPAAVDGEQKKLDS